MQARIDRNATITPPAIAAALAAEKREEGERERRKEREGKLRVRNLIKMI